MFSYNILELKVALIIILILRLKTLKVLKLKLIFNCIIVLINFDNYDRIQLT